MKSDLFFLLENASWPALLVEESGTIRRSNQAAVAVFGPILEGEQASLSAIWSPENSSTAEKFLGSSEAARNESVPLKFQVKGGISSAFSASISAVNRDGQKYLVFQLFKAGSNGSVESATAQKQKLDCALQLARSVALDFNNTLTGILGHSSFLLAHAEANHPWRNSLVEIEKSALKAAEISSDLAAFSRNEKEPRVQAAGNLNALLQRTVAAFRTPDRERISWSLQLERRLFSAVFDEAKIQQAFSKILENAIEAIPVEGRIAIQTRNLELSAPTQDRNAKLSPGTYICVEFSDTGAGIDDETLPRIFEPFFTTKNPSRHRGLGLVWVYGIVTNHAGGVAVSSHPGNGTSVRIYLPANKTRVKDFDVEIADLRGTQTILLVDDEDLLLTMGQIVLSSYGYDVLTANSGQKALEIFSKSQKKIHLVLTDLVMPNMSGRELIEKIRPISPETKFICASGYVRTNTAEDNDLYLQKPFTSQDLLRKVKQVLEGGS